MPFDTFFALLRIRRCFDWFASLTAQHDGATHFVILGLSKDLRLLQWAKGGAFLKLYHLLNYRNILLQAVTFLLQKTTSWQISDYIFRKKEEKNQNTS